MKQMAEAKSKMIKTIESFFSQIQGIRQGSIDSGFVSSLKVSAYGQTSPVGHLAEVFDGDGRVSIIPYDANLVPSIANGLKKCGLEAYKFSKMEVAITKPPPSLEDREQVFSQIRRLGEDAKVGVRNIRKKCKQQLKRLKLDEAELSRAEKDLQRYTDDAIREVSKAITDKVSKLKEGTGWPFSSRRKRR